MHARIEQLLSLRDGEPLDAAASAHVAACRECNDALARLRDRRERLRGLPMVTANPEGWSSVQAGLAAQALASRRRARASQLLAVASVAALAVFAGVQLLGSRTASRVPAGVVAKSRSAERGPVDQLRARSRALEELLAGLPLRPAVERADTSLPIETLEAQVQWLDHQLSLTGAEEPVAQDAERLWRERVAVMSSLVQLRYVEAQRMVL